MNLINHVLHVDNQDMERIKEILDNGYDIVEAMRFEIVEEHEYDLEEIEAIKFNPNYFHLSSLLVINLPKLRLIEQKKLLS